MNNNQPQDHNNHPQAHDYRPRSPNFSGFQAPQPPRPNRLPSIPDQGNSGFPPGYSFQHRGSYDASPYFSPQASQPQSYFGTQTQQSPYSVNHPPQQFFNQSVPFQPLQDDMARLRSRPQGVNYNDDAFPVNEFDERVALQQHMQPQPQPIMAAHLPAQQQFQLAQPLAAMVPPPQQPLLPQVDVRTKFPVARIKRIMQTDEDIGKVAQATPTAVAKALELFMIALVSKGANHAKDQNSKRVTATHLKNALLADPQFDFLNEICENTPDENAKKSRPKSEAKSEDSDDEDIAGASAPKKRKGGKKKKTGGDDSD